MFSPLQAATTIALVTLLSLGKILGTPTEMIKRTSEQTTAEKTTTEIQNPVLVPKCDDPRTPCKCVSKSFTTPKLKQYTGYECLPDKEQNTTMLDILWRSGLSMQCFQVKYKKRFSGCELRYIDKPKASVIQF